MKLCNNNCTPCCDFCINAVHEAYWNKETGNYIIGPPINCNLHDDKEHQDKAINCDYCNDFDCFNNYPKEE